MIKLTKDRAKILGTYALCLAAAACSALPDFTAQNAGMALTLIALLVAYMLRGGQGKDTLVYHHLTFIIRTIWIYSAIAAVAVAGAGFTISREADMTAVDQMVGQVMDTGIIPGMAEMEAAEAAFLDANKALILNTLIMYMMPGLLYFIWRVLRGVTRAWRNYRVVNIYAIF